jgi:hypothetical protein
MDTSDKYLKLLAEAEELAPLDDWQLIYRKILGPEGEVRQLSPEEQVDFYGSTFHRDILQLIAKLRENGPYVAQEPTRVITVRLPKSIHESLRSEAHDCHTSMNQLCISKLLQGIDANLVPRDTSANYTARRS